MSMSNQGSSGSSGNFPVDNLTYDLVTILYEKSKGLEAYDKYMRDAQGDQACTQLLQQLRQQDQQNVQQVQQHLARLLGNQGGMSRSVGGSSSMGGSSTGGSSSMGGSSMGGTGHSGGTSGSRDF